MEHGRASIERGARRELQHRMRCGKRVSMNILLVCIAHEHVLLAKVIAPFASTGFHFVGTSLSGVEDDIRSRSIAKLSGRIVSKQAQPKIEHPAHTARKTAVPSAKSKVAKKCLSLSSFGTFVHDFATVLKLGANVLVVTRDAMH